jgi:hypothetical protein
MAKMTVTEHADIEIALKAEIAELVRQLRESEYRTKTEKAVINMKLAEKRATLREHISIPISELTVE